LKKVLANCLMVCLASVAMAIEPGQVAYVGGTAATLKEGAVGKLDMSSETALRFESGGTVVEIPYAKIQSFKYTEQVTHHMGVLPAIAIGLSRSRKHRHHFLISFAREGSAPQVVVLEVPKQMPPVLLAVLRARSPEVCKNDRRPPCRH